MERLTKRVERLEQNTQQIKTDLAVLTERSNNFATKTEVESLRTDQFKLRGEMLGGFARLEKQMAERFERVDEKFERIDEKFERIDEKFERIDEKFERMDDKFERVNERFDRLNDRITWTLLAPALLAVLGWLAKEVMVSL